MNYEEMTKEELNKLAAEGIMQWTTRVFEETNQFAYGEGVNPWSFRMDFENWNPTHPDSNQCERYLFPKLTDAGCRVHFQINKESLIFFVCNDVDGKVISGGKSKQEINKTKVIAVLKAWDKLKEGNEL